MSIRRSETERHPPDRYTPAIGNNNDKTVNPKPSKDQPSVSAKSSTSSSRRRLMEVELKKLEEMQKLERAHEEREMERQRQVEEMERQRRMEARELERQKQLLTARAELESASVCGSQQSSRPSNRSETKITLCCLGLSINLDDEEEPQSKVERWLNEKEPTVLKSSSAIMTSAVQKLADTFQKAIQPVSFRQKLPSFSGKPDEWPIFFSEYEKTAYLFSEDDNLIRIDTYALLDDGSTVSLLDSATADKLGVNGSFEPLTTCWSNATQHFDPTSMTGKVKIKGLYEDEVFTLNNVRTQSPLDLPKQMVDTVKLKKKWSHLRSIGQPLPSGNLKPTILIGQDNCDLILARKIIEGPPNSPVLSWSRLGWTLHGKCHEHIGRVDSQFTLTSFESEKLHDIIKDSFEIENYGVSLVEDDNVKSVEDETALKILEDTTKKVGDRYESGLLWKSEDFKYPPSYENALKRLKGIERKMARDENFHNKYKAKITDYEEKGYIRKLRDDEATVINDRTYYLPHFGAINPNKPDKLRLVFDAAAKANGVSFNDGLLSGPDLLNPLPAVLLKFRLRKFAIAGDIQEMFHQVRIRKEDVDSQRFLWREDPNNEPDTYIMEAMIFGSTCSPSTALYVVNSNAKRFLQIYPEASKAILCSEYMDDLLDSTDTEEEARIRIQQITEIHKSGGFKICNWLSNSKEILLEIPEDLKTNSTKQLQPESRLPTERILGMWWDAETDHFSFHRNAEKIFWSDSVTVLHWLKSDPRQFKQYVSNRIGEIQDLSKPEEWRWVPPKQNPADVATRSNKKFTSAMHSEWIHGPSFLMRESSDWPIQPATLQVKDNEETKKKFVGVVNSNENPPLLTVENFSSWEKVTRVLAWVHRFVSMLRSHTTTTTKKKLKTVNVDFGNIPELQPEEIQKAEKDLISMSQKASFNEEKNLLLKNKPLPKSSRIFSLNPFIDQSLIRMSSRIHSSPEISEEQKHPIILDGKSHTAKLIVKMFHEKCFHQGIETVINMTRQQFWILNVRSVAKKVQRSCMRCSIDNAQPYPPQMAALPQLRTSKVQHPFFYTGVDYFGPIEVTVGRRHEKRYGVLFTCLSTRAIHIETAHSLNTESCIMAIQRFISRRPVPSELYSDNGTNFVAADRELRNAVKSLKHEKIQKDVVNYRIKWNFICPRAPHMGGCWERLVRSVKTALRSVMRCQYPKDEELQTFMVRVEFIINSRPLTHVSLDPNDPEPITPNHFLREAYKINLNKDQLCKRQLARVKSLLDGFWKRWVHEYLPCLSRRCKWHKKLDPPKIDDLAIIIEENCPRNTWPLGRISAVYPGHDGQERIVDITTSKGTYRRPLTKVAVLTVGGEKM
ncbi:uncharacterized protein LOC128996429 [Macrosteles quadrilineatus]|uniref:uncharacterized protein LOC128996429 n=1 Tax=Macrosteles quadrilineatus TaxID=74068 RepID=UPI0023E2DAAA|nr:uncharacterized protein LOC128996429 [Macrosteles quadrilineatus]